VTTEKAVLGMTKAKDDRALPVVAGVKTIFVKVGALPFFLAAALIFFTFMSIRFVSVENLTNVARQSVYLILVSLGQMLVLITGGFDLSVGTTIALTSVVSATVMVFLNPIMPDMTWLVLLAGIGGGGACAIVVGSINGVGVARFGVSPFIMTLGVQSAGFGVALFITGGVPVTGFPDAFNELFGFGRILGVPVPVLLAVMVVVIMWIVMNRTQLGAHIYAVGGNAKAAQLSGVNIGRVLFLSYVFCALITSLSGLLLTARVQSGESNLGGTVALESIAACVIGGVSLRGGIGRVGSVVLGAFFIALLQNGMDIAEIGSYMQMVLLGSLLVLAVVLDQVRYRMLTGG
jgi:ribose transport system permease protein